MTAITYRYLIRDVDRHGNARWYVRRHGRKIRLRAEPGSEAFSSAYHQALTATATPSPARTLGAQPGTWRHLCEAYIRSAATRQLDAMTQRQRRYILEETWAEPVHPGAAETFAAFPLDRLTLAALEVLRDRKSATPGARSNRVKAIRAVCRWAADQRPPLLAHNPARDLRKPALTGGGWHTWTDDEIARFEARHPIGSKARLALALLLYTGARRSDVIRLGRQHARDGRLRWRPHKGRARGSEPIDIPLLPGLSSVLEVSPLGDMTWLVNGYGRPFTHAGFGNWFRARCIEAGLPHCSAHGMRKAGATRAAEHGATAHELMAMYGWRNLDEAEIYTRSADRRRMATAGMHKLARGG